MTMAAQRSGIEIDLPSGPVLPPLFTVEDLLEEPARKQINDFLHMTGWKFGWKSSRKSDTFAFWHKHFAGRRRINGEEQEQYPCADELKTRAPLIHGFWLGLAETALKGHTLYRCYANGQSYGSEGTVHTDSKSDRSYTAVYYPHETWQPDWGGETVLFNDDKSDILASIYPKPNRLAVFKGSIPHVARGVSRICPVLRVVLAFKTEYGEADDRGAA
jgi:SM-20-related protein